MSKDLEELIPKSFSSKYLLIIDVNKIINLFETHITITTIILE